jgi:MFS family permease
MAVLTVAIGTFMSSLDSSVVNLVTPMIRKDFGISLSTVVWIVTAYLLVISSLLLTFGRISDLYGHKKMYRAGFVVFTAGSLLCGLSGSIVLLILCRVVQAFGAGMLFSTGPAIITNNPASLEYFRGLQLAVAGCGRFDCRRYLARGSICLL